MPIEKRTRVEIFFPLRSDLLAYQTIMQWTAEEFAYARGGSTLTTPFAGLYTSDSRIDIVEDSIRILFCDFDLNLDDRVDYDKLVLYLEKLERGLIKALEEEEIWIVFYPISRIVS